jgi:shikimate kinase
MENSNQNLRDRLKGINVYLIGMMGAGKTSVGRFLAQHLDYRFFDTDAVIEQVAKKSINDIFASDGEESFRKLESQVLSELSAYTKLAIATGGGIILKRENWSYLQNGLVIWLDVPVEILIARLQHDTTRPLLKNADMATEFPKRFEQRKPLYAQADLHITVREGQTPEQIATQVIEAIPSVLKPKQDNNGQ